MRIVRLQAENVKKIKAIDITPKDDLIIISGKNGQGKTSVLDSIWFALQNREGSKNTPQPIRKGEKKASIILTLDDFIVTRSWTSDDKSYLKVTNREGLKYDSPQDLLDGFLGELTFDPLKFAQMSDKDQRQLLLTLANVDVGKYDEKIAALREARRVQGQKVRLYEGERDTRDFTGTPNEEIDVIGIQSELEEAIDFNRDIDSRQHNQIYNNKQIADRLNDIETYKEQIKRCEELIKECEAENFKDSEYIRKNPKKDIDSIRAKMNKALEINELVQAKNRNVATDRKWSSAKTVYDTYTKDIESFESEKMKALKEAKMPLKGLSVNDTGVIYNGIPFSQLSSSEQLKISMAIAIALNPKLKVIRITDGSLLDNENMIIIKKMSQDNDFQVWVERVEDSSEIAFIIEEGMVKE